MLAVPSNGGSWTDGEPFGPNRIVIPTDGSDDAARAADHAIELAAYSGATVDAIYVIDDTIASSGALPGASSVARIGRC